MHWLCNWSVGKFYLQLNLSSPDNWWPAFGPRQGLSSGYCEKSRSWLLQAFSFILWNKTHILWFDKKINVIFFLCPLHPYPLPTVHCISALCFNQSSPLAEIPVQPKKTTFSQHQDNSLKYIIPSWCSKGPQ